MSRFVEKAIARAGLMPVLTARRAGDIETIRVTMTSWRSSDLMALGAVADLVRDEEVGGEVCIYELADGDAAPSGSSDVVWVTKDTNDLDMLRDVAVARLTTKAGTRVGIDWGTCGLELAQIALGFGATDLRGSISRKSGLPILDEETKKVKGQGMVDLKTLQRQEIAALIRYAGREPVFVEEARRGSAQRRGSSEVAGA